jgi:hypothetical protein
MTERKPISWMDSLQVEEHAALEYLNFLVENWVMSTFSDSHMTLSLLVEKFTLMGICICSKREKSNP